MKKIPTLYLRDYTGESHGKHVTGELTPGCEWVLRDEGVATRKFDGTCCMLDADGRWWSRREVKPGKRAPVGFVHVTTDEKTLKVMGWEPVENSGFAKYFAEALAYHDALYPIIPLEPGTYELIGEKINGNPEVRPGHSLGHSLVRHGLWDLGVGAPLDHIAFCRARGWEGVVWHHPDGRMAQLKVRDYPDG